MRPSNDLENKNLSDKYWRVQLVCMKVQVNISLEPPPEYNEVGHDLFNRLGSFMIIFGVT